MSNANGFGVHADADSAELDLAVRRQCWRACTNGMASIRVGQVRSAACRTGLTSRDAVALAAELSELAEVALPATVLWESSRHSTCSPGTCARQTAHAATQRSRALPRRRPQRSGTRRHRDRRRRHRLPLARRRSPSPEDFWRLLSDGGDAIGRCPTERWDGFVAAGDPARRRGARHGGFLDDIAGFDAEFFGITPVEAAADGPAAAAVLEVAREALDHAAIPPAALARQPHRRVRRHQRQRIRPAHDGRPGPRRRVDAVRAPRSASPRTGCHTCSTCAARAWPWTPPAPPRSSPCTTPCRSLRAGECDAALAAGVNALLSPAVTMAFDAAPGARRPTVAARPSTPPRTAWCAREGCGVLVLKRLADAGAGRGPGARRDPRHCGQLGRPVQRSGRAERRGAASTARAGAARRAGSRPRRVDYVETHGTGTRSATRSRPGRWARCSAPGGRRTAAADRLGQDQPRPPRGRRGYRGLVKTVLALHRGTVPKQLHFAEPSPHIDFEANALRVVTEAEPWPRYSGTATAGVSAFGFGGTNAHVLVQEYRPAASSAGARADRPWPRPSRSPRCSCSTLRRTTGCARRPRRLATWLRSEPGGRTDRPTSRTRCSAGSARALARRPS